MRCVGLLGRGVSWRVFEKESYAKHFDKVDTIRIGPIPDRLADADVCFWRLDTECTGRVLWHQACVAQKLRPDCWPINSPVHWLAAHSKVDCFERWRRQGIPCPDWKVITTKKQAVGAFPYPYLVRVDNESSGRLSWLVNNDAEALTAGDNALDFRRHGVNPRAICVPYIPTGQGDIHYSYRIIVAADEVIAGYARVSKGDWVAITHKFTNEIAESWLEHNRRCAVFCREHKDELVKAVHCLGLNFQGVDVIFDQAGNPYYLEVQPAFSVGYSDPCRNTPPPFYNPAKGAIRDWLLANMGPVKREIPWYAERWLDKSAMFDAAFAALRREYDRWSSTATSTAH